MREEQGMHAREQRAMRQNAAPLRAAALVVGLCAFALTPALHAQITSDVVHQYNLNVTGPTGQPERVLVTLPRLPGHALNPEGERWPLLVALHGRGEAAQGPTRGYLGWNVMYGLPRAFAALQRGRLTTADYGGFVRPQQLEQRNAQLARQRFQGIAVVTPFVPDLLAPESADALAQYEAWLAGPLLEQVRAAYPGLARTRAGTGIDGVSMGGRVSLSTGLRFPDVFGSVGGIQPAVRGDAETLSARASLEKPQFIRLVSSDGDPFLPATRALSEAFRARGVSHDLVVVPGPHDYEFNRGPGGLELLQYHAGVLARERIAAP
jgi:pimeloyl-ACP methyl ester carboxylesterase